MTKGKWRKKILAGFWGILALAALSGCQESLSDEFQEDQVIAEAKEMDELYAKYRPIEMDYSISKNDKEKYMKKWYEDCMDLYYKYNLTKQKCFNPYKIAI